MNIKRAKEEIEHTVKAYLAKDALANTPSRPSGSVPFCSWGLRALARRR